MPAYLIALAEGGLMEHPEITYRNYQVIKESSAKKAREKYNLINNCSFYYGNIMATLNCRTREVTIVNKAVPIGELDKLKAFVK